MYSNFLSTIISLSTIIACFALKSSFFFSKCILLFLSKNKSLKNSIFGGLFHLIIGSALHEPPKSSLDFSNNGIACGKTKT